MQFSYIKLSVSLIFHRKIFKNFVSFLELVHIFEKVLNNNKKQINKMKKHVLFLAIGFLVFGFGLGTRITFSDATTTNITAAILMAIGLIIALVVSFKYKKEL